MSQERIVFLDPRGSLRYLREVLARPGAAPEVLIGPEELLRPPPAGGSPPNTVVVLDGDLEGGLVPELLGRLGEAAPELPPAVVAVVNDRARGRAWLAAGAGGLLVHPVDPEELRTEVSRWLRFGDRLRSSGRRIEALRKFFAMFAHDLKNPLNAISGYCELVSVHPDLPAEAREDLEKVRRNIDLLVTMSQGLLEMVRGNARLKVSPREADLNQVVREAVDMMRVRATARSIDLRLRAPGPPVEVRIDSPRIIEALANVLDNAIKFSPDGAAIEVGVAVEGGEALITVDDEGPGIPLADREQVFDKFAQAAAHGHQGGLGLGLSIARDLIELHRGVIWVEGRTPRGTRMAIRLPRSPAPAAGEVLDGGAVPAGHRAGGEEAGS